MSSKNPYNKSDLRGFLKSIPPEVIEEQTKLQLENDRRLYLEFMNKLQNGICGICGDKIDSFNENAPCFHWFTYPSGIKKKHFERYLKNPIGFFRLDSYFRWLANSEKPIGNINDLKEETSSNSYLESTYKYKNIEWAISIGHTDKDGHENAKIGSSPHYHIQMKVDGNIFLKFNDFHISFTDEDLFFLEMQNQAPDLIKIEHQYGDGIGVLEDEQKLGMIDNLMKVTDDIENATFFTQTIIEAPEGQTISSEIVYKAIQESKKTKEPVRKIIQRLISEANITVIISPGDGIPEMSKRSGKK